MFIPHLKGYAISKSHRNTTANNQINIGSIGINGMGWGNTLRAIEIPGVNLLAVHCLPLWVVDSSILDNKKP